MQIIKKAALPPFFMINKGADFEHPIRLFTLFKF
jgi:hypothetical protein